MQWKLIAAAGLVAALGCTDRKDAVTAFVVNVPDTSSPAMLPPQEPGADAPLARFGSDQALLSELADAPQWYFNWGFQNFGWPTPMPIMGAPTLPASPVGPTSGGPSSGPSGPASGNSSSTTIQEAGVDESDLVKHDGKFLYVCSNSKLRIVDVQNAAVPQQVAALDLPAHAAGLYLSNGRAVVLCNGSGTMTSVTVADVSVPQAPVVESQRFFDGSLAASRVIDGRMILMLHNQSGWGPSPPAGETSELVQDFLPNLRRSPTDAGVELLRATDVWHHKAITTETRALITIATFDVTDIDGTIDAVGVLDHFNTEYVSLDAIYLADTQFPGGATETEIHKFRLWNGTAHYVGSGTVPGRVLDSYCLGEHAGYLRVATRDLATGSTWQAATTVSVLRERDGDLAVTGQLTDIVPGEQPNACRFVGDRGYLITVVQVTDPLVTLDLSDPAAPRAVGMFEYQGVADFLYPISEHRILAIGRMAVSGSTWPRGVEMSLFDVSDMANPIRVSSLQLASPLTSTSSPALFDPHAFTWYGAANLAAVPILGTNYDMQSGTWVQTHEEIIVEVRGDSLLGRGALPLVGAPHLNGTSYVQWGRGLFINSEAYAVTPDGVATASIFNVTQAGTQVVTFP